MRKQKIQKSSNPKSYDFNSMILAGKPNPIQAMQITKESYEAKLKQLKALKKFEQIFKKQMNRFEPSKIQNNSVKLDNKSLIKQSPHELSNRLKGMFFLRKKAEFQYKLRLQSEEEDNNSNPPIEGRTVSPTRYARGEKEKTDKSLVQKSTIKQLNFVRNNPQSSGKILRKNFDQPRPSTQIESKINHLVFNNQMFYSAILAANKIKMGGQKPLHFMYFSVYVEDGNNSQMIKSAVRKRPGWKVVEMAGVANMIWSQVYKRAYDIKLKSKKNQERIYEQNLNSSNKMNITNLTIDYGSPKKKKLQASQLNNPNLLSLHEYNKQIQKICPKWQHLHRKTQYTMSYSSNTISFYNHIPNNHFITDKKNLLKNLKLLFDKKGKNIFEVIPFSLQLNEVTQLQDIISKIPEDIDQQGYWIVKPGQNSNRGKGIVVCKGINSAIQQINSRYSLKTISQTEQLINVCSKQNIQDIKARKERQQDAMILQKYIQPLLYFKRKFDIRMYMLVTSVNKKIRGYIFNEGYIRTSSKLFTLENFNKFVHLTNDAIQARSSDYGKFQQGNKVSWKRFQRWVEQEGNYDFWPNFVKEYKKICGNILESVKQSFTKNHSKYGSENLLSHKNKRLSTKSQVQNKSTLQQNEGPLSFNLTSNEQNKIYFQIFGLDFLIDDKLKTWLIQVNTNPALTTDCSRVVNTLVPKMIDHAFTIAVEPYLHNSSHRYGEHSKFENNFQAIYDDEWNS